MKLVLLVPDLDQEGALDIAMARRWLSASRAPGLTVFEADIGAAARTRHGTAMPPETGAMLRMCDAAFAPFSTSDGDRERIEQLTGSLFRPLQPGDTALLTCLEACVKALLDRSDAPG